MGNKEAASQKKKINIGNYDVIQQPQQYLEKIFHIHIFSSSKGLEAVQNVC